MKSCLNGLIFFQLCQGFPTLTRNNSFLLLGDTGAGGVGGLTQPRVSYALRLVGAYKSLLTKKSSPM